MKNELQTPFKTVLSTSSERRNCLILYKCIAVNQRIHISVIWP